ncbi:MAG TPA: rhodanese-like domain-containing protein [Solirubrobacterales bacterium]|nr:rhodanese-like domain-containing protein [Solirubrobacterales bacterium]
MFFHQLLDPDLGCASYVLGCEGRAVVVDPGIDTGRYLDCLAAEDARLETILETHTHADHVSGREALAAATGARIRVPWGEGEEALAASEVIEVGAVAIEVIAAAGHRPEHIALAVTDSARGKMPWLLLSGDSLLVGDLARPDLAVDPRDGSHALHETLARLCELGDGVEVWPGHVGGSLCGGPGLSAKTSSTIGFERLANPLVSCADGDQLFRALMEKVPPRPPTVERVVARNAGGPPPPPPLRALGAEEVREALGQRPGTILVDGRAAADFEAAHLPGSVNLPLGGSGLGTRAGWVIDPEAPIVVLADGEDDCADLALRLRAVGIDGILGTVPGGVADLRAAGLRLHSEPSIGPGELARRLDGFVVVDVRERAEWEEGHVEGSVHLPLHLLRDADRLPGAPLAVACMSGARAAFAASWLRRQGHEARRVGPGGIPDLAAHGIDLAVGG